jgi:SWI/SNF-related matrix-associated actin-dependent regulator of chromatin subfamily D
MPHLSTLPPIKLAYTIRVDQEYQANPTPTVYDILVPGPDPLREQILAIAQNPSFADDLKKINELDKQIALTVQSINQSKARHSFFLSLSKDPVTFIKRWLSSQKRDMEIILGDSRVGTGNEWMGDEFRRGGKDGVWASDNIKEAVDLMVNRPGRWGK